MDSDDDFIPFKFISKKDQKKARKEKKSKSSKSNKKSKSPKSGKKKSSSPTYSPSTSPLPAVYDEDVTTFSRSKSSTTTSLISNRGSISTYKVNRKEKRKRSEREERFERDREEFEEGKRKRAVYEPKEGEGWGTSTELSKPYTRLTSAPPTSTLRSLPYLQIAMSHWTQSYEDDACLYGRYIEEVKGIRQDMTVQGLEVGFTWRVYYECMRTAMEEGDEGEGGVCRGRLTEMLTEGKVEVVGSDDEGEGEGVEGSKIKVSQGNVDNVVAIAIVDKLIKDPEGVGGVVKKLQPWFEGLGEESKTELAMKVVGWRGTGNWAGFFKAYKNEMGLFGYALDGLVRHFREVGWKQVKRGYMKIEVRVLEEWWGMEEGEGGKWVEDRGGKVEGGVWAREKK